MARGNYGRKTRVAIGFGIPPRPTLQDRRRAILPRPSASEPNMPFWPVAAREARSAARAPRTYAWRAVVTAIGIAIVPISLWLSRSAASPGRALFIALSGTAFVYCLFGGVLRTADAIAEEKRENTLGLLFLTDLKVSDVISGKL